MKKFFILALALAAFTACQESMEEKAARDARNITEKKCPMPLGDEGNIVLERVAFDIPTRTWTEEMLLDVPEGGELNEEEIREALIQELKNIPSYKPYIDNGFNFQYLYYRMSNPKDTLINMTLTTKDYR